MAQQVTINYGLKEAWEKSWAFPFRVGNMPLYEKTNTILEGFTMKKLLLVVFVIVVLAMNVYGAVVNHQENNDDPATVVYME